MAQGFFHGDEALLDRPGVAAERLHGEGGNALLPQPALADL